jgi:hypothetical protein
MKFYDLKSYYIVTEINEHINNKMDILSLINSTKSNSITKDDDFVTKTDWEFQNEKKDYLEKFYTMIRPYMDKMTYELKCTEWNISNAWFQIYNKKSKHNWHLHNNTNYTNIYYLHLPISNLKTQLYDIRNEKVIDNIEVKEGQLLTFPAHIIHRSPENYSDEPKVIISFNSNFDKVNI